jgi:hypothetical protein
MYLTHEHKVSHQERYKINSDKYTLKRCIIDETTNLYHISQLVLYNSRLHEKSMKQIGDPNCVHAHYFTKISRKL